jgi:hypothetical protein
MKTIIEHIRSEPPMPNLKASDIEKIKLLSKAGTTPDVISKTLEIPSNLVRDYLKDLKMKEAALKAKEEIAKKKALKNKIQNDTDDEDEELMDESRFHIQRESKYTRMIKQTGYVAPVDMDPPSKNDIERMRRLRQLGFSVYKIAATFGVSYNAIYRYISDIKPNRTYREIKVNFSQHDIDQIKYMVEEGFKLDQIARFIECSEPAIKRILDLQKKR